MPVGFATFAYQPTPGRTRVPLAVRLRNGNVDRLVKASAVRFSAVTPGGYEDATITLAVPLDATASEIAHLTDCIVYDTRCADVVWQGRLKVPGRGGLVQQIQAEGPMAHLEDRTVPLVYVDRRLDPFVRSSYNNRGSETTQADDELELKAPRGVDATTGWDADMICRTIMECGQTIARFRSEVDAGVNDSDWTLELLTRTGSGSGTTIDSAGASTTAGILVSKLVSAGGSIPAGDNVCHVRLRRTGAGTTVANDSTWASFGPLAIRTVVKDAAGADILTGYLNSTVLPHEVVADLLGRLLTHIDGATAQIDATPTLAIDQLAYPDGVTARHLLEDLIALVGDWFFACWEWTVNRKWSFVWAPYPTAVGFRLRRAEHQYDPPTGSDPFNECAVRWLSPGGRVKSTRRTLSVPALTAAGLTRTTLLDLGDVAASTDLANQAGDVELAVSQGPTTGGRAVVSGPLHDMASGRTLLPHQLPRNIVGRLVQVDLPRASFMLPPVRDGVEVLRVVRAEYDSASASCTLELDAQFRFTARQARLRRQIEGRRRR